MLRRGLLSTLALIGLVACGEPPGDVTYSRDVAPILYEHCVSCHRPGESAPFELVTYDQVERRAQQVAEVTISGYMPPWLPEPGEHALMGERRLTDDQIETVRRWLKVGAPEGDADDLPPMPELTEGWQLGEPDLVVTLDRPYTLVADGVDAFRNFVIPIPVERTRYVRAVELHPGNKRIVHHAVMRIDRTPSSRRLDARDAEIGFAGMTMGNSEPPDGHFLGWTPGRVPYPGTEGMAWRLDRGTDLVLQLHMLPTGRPETIQPSVGFYFSDEPPTLRPSVLTLYNNDIDIPAGEQRYLLEDAFVLPVDVELFGIYPHAHYLGKEILALATLPDGSETELLRIDDWDFNWQDEYRYDPPVALPAGTTMRMRFVYDNSSGNVRNPNIPPRRVAYGNQSSDEMGTMTLQLLTGSEADRVTLAEAKARWLLGKIPDDWEAHNNLGNALLAQGRTDDAIRHFRRALELQPTLDEAHYNLGVALAARGDLEPAAASYRRALESNPAFAAAENNLGNLRLAQGRTEEAIAHFLRAVKLEPGLDEAHYNLGLARADQGRIDEAVEHYRQAIAANPELGLAHSNLGALLYSRGEVREGTSHFRRAVELDPDSAEAHNNLGFALAEQGEREQALEHFRAALRIDPQNAPARRNLAAIQR